MVYGLIGKKIGMTQVFDSAGNAVPVTVLRAGPCVVVDKRSDKDGVTRLQLGFVDPGRKVKVSKPLAGHFKRAGVPPALPLKEFGCSPDEEPANIGDQVLVADVFGENDLVDVTGRTKGRGFQGVVKRHHFRGGRATHGSMFHRAPGSIGASAYPSRVFPGMRAAGRMGNVQVKARRLRVIKLDAEQNLLLVKGAVPGSRGGFVLISRSVR